MHLVFSAYSRSGTHDRKSSNESNVTPRSVGLHAKKELARDVFPDCFPTRRANLSQEF